MPFCKCGGYFKDYKSKVRHIRTKKHILYMSTNESPEIPDMDLMKEVIIVNNVNITTCYCGHVFNGEGNLVSRHLTSLIHFKKFKELQSEYY